MAFGTIVVVAGVLRLAASTLAADTKGRRDAIYWVVAGTVAAIAQL